MGAAPPICLSFLRHLDRLQTIKEGAAQARVAQGSERKIEIPEEEERPSNVIGLMEALRRSAEGKRARSRKASHCAYRKPKTADRERESADTRSR